MSEQPDIPVALTPAPRGYADWLVELKSRIHTAQQRDTLAVNRELVLLYWQIGHDILTRQAREGWGSKVIERLAHDLRTAFPEMKGFSRANLMYMQAFAEAWPDEIIVQQAVGQLPWGHNLVLLTKLKDPKTRLAYGQRAIQHGWSWNVWWPPCRKSCKPACPASSRLNVNWKIRHKSEHHDFFWLNMARA